VTPNDEHIAPNTHTDEKAIAENGTAKSSGGNHQNKDASHHTFYIQNSQRRLKLVAKNEVRFPSLVFSPGTHPLLATTLPMDYINGTNG
jgi:hypothetical protein